MLRTMILGGKVFTAAVLIAGVWAWATGDGSFFAQLMRILLPLTLGGHLFMAIMFYLWGRKLKIATFNNLLQVLLFGMFHVAEVWLKRADAEEVRQ